MQTISKFSIFFQTFQTLYKYLLGPRYSPSLLLCRVAVSSSSQNYQKCNCSAKRHEMRVGVTWVIPFFAYQWGYQHLLKCPKVLWVKTFKKVDLPLVIGTSKFNCIEILACFARNFRLNWNEGRRAFGTLHSSEDLIVDDEVGLLEDL